MVKLIESEFIRDVLTDEERERMEALIPLAIAEGQLRLNFNFGLRGIDVDMLKEGCATKTCVRRKVEYHKEKHIDSYNATIANARALPFAFLGYSEMENTAKHVFFEALFADLISVIEVFGSENELNLWLEVRSEYLTTYQHYTEVFLANPVGEIVKDAVAIPVAIGKEILSATTQGVAQGLGIDFSKFKTIAIAIIVIVIIIAILILVAKLRYWIKK